MRKEANDVGSTSIRLFFFTVTLHTVEFLSFAWPTDVQQTQIIDVVFLLTSKSK